MVRIHGNSMLLGLPKCRKFGTILKQQPCLDPQEKWRGEMSFLAEDQPQKLNQVWTIVLANFYDQNMVKLLKSNVIFFRIVLQHGISLYTDKQIIEKKNTSKICLEG